jgi:hypothetical protein
MARRCCSNCEGRAGVDGEVAAVVRAQRELVDEHLRGEEQLDWQQARDVDAVGEADGPPSGLVGALGREGDGGEYVVADRVVLAGLHDRVGGNVAAGVALDEHGQLALDVDVGLHDEPAPRGAGALPELTGALGVVADPDAASVIAVGASLDDDRPPVAFGEGVDVRRVSTSANGGTGNPTWASVSRACS